MSITLGDGVTLLALDDDLFWNDEFAWSPVEQAIQRTLSGALIVSTAARVAGRPITLQPFDESSAWMAGAAIRQLCDWAAVPGQQLTLVLRGVTYAVIFRHHDGSAVEATPIVPYSDPVNTDHYLATLRLMEI